MQVNCSNVLAQARAVSASPVRPRGSEVELVTYEASPEEALLVQLVIWTNMRLELPPATKFVSA